MNASPGPVLGLVGEPWRDVWSAEREAHRRAGYRCHLDERHNTLAQPLGCGVQGKRIAPCRKVARRGDIDRRHGDSEGSGRGHIASPSPLVGRSCSSGLGESHRRGSMPGSALTLAFVYITMVNYSWSTQGRHNRRLLSPTGQHRNNGCLLRVVIGGILCGHGAGLVGGNRYAIPHGRYYKLPLTRSSNYAS